MRMLVYAALFLLAGGAAALLLRGDSGYALLAYDVWTVELSLATLSLIILLLFALPVFIGVVFLGGFRFYVPDDQVTLADAGQAAISIAKYVLILVFFVLVRNTNPRVRVDQAMRFFLGPMTFLAFIALILAVVVHWMSVG